MERNELLTTLVNTPVNEPISQSDLAKAFALPPFINVPGVFNTRDLTHPPYIRPGLIYRSGSPANLTPEGKSLLSNSFHIKTIFDLRSVGEKAAMPIPNLEQDFGIQVISLSYDTDPAALDITDFISDASDPELGNGGARGTSKTYLEMLSIYKSAFRTVLTHLLKSPNSPILFNCTAGKDRTGVLAALILSLAGVPDEDIAFDYVLTRIGFEPQKDFLSAIIKKWKPEWNEDTHGVREFSAVRKEYMLRFLKDAGQEYGGIDGGSEDWAEAYVRKELGFSKKEFEILRKNLR